MKWSGQHIYDLISRFRNDVYLEDISTGTIASGAHLGLDSNNKIVKAADGGGDLTSIVAGTGLSGTSLTGPIPTLNVDASLTHVTSVGTIGTGTWQGTAIASAYLDADTAHLSGTQTFTGAKTFSAATTTFTSATADSPLIKVLNTTDDDQASQLIFEKLRDDNAVASGQNIGEIWFKGQDAAQNTQNYGVIFNEIDVSTGGQESGKLNLGVAAHDGDIGVGLILTGGSVDAEIDVEIGKGAASVVTIPGHIDLAGDIDVDGTLETDALTIGGATIAAIGTTAITTLGTITTGVWNGTAITKAKGGTGLAGEDDGKIVIADGSGAPSFLDVGSSTGITILGTVATGVWEGTAVATDQQKHLMHYQTIGYGTPDGTNYDVSQQMSTNTAPFKHDASIGADGLTAQTVSTWIRLGGHVMPRACTLKKWTGWVTANGSGTHYIGLFKVTLTRNDSTTVSAVLLEEFSFTALGNNKVEDFAETSFTATAIAAGDILVTALKGVSGKIMYFNASFEVEF